LPTSSATLLAIKASYQQEVAFLMPPAVEAVTSKETAPNSAKGTGDTGTLPFLQCNVAMASIEEMQVKIHCLEQLE
jgi:hypothetical protein